MKAEEDLMAPATKAGDHGRAWKADLDSIRRKLGTAPEDDAGLSVWIVEAPWAHPFWHSYLVSLVHLRPMPDGRETNFYHPNATHEFWIEAMNPDLARRTALEGKRPVLTPVNFAAQLVQPSDAAAIATIEGAIDLILSGELNPDTDAQRQWEALFGNAMIKPGWRVT